MTPWGEPVSAIGRHYPKGGARVRQSGEDGRQGAAQHRLGAGQAAPEREGRDVQPAALVLVQGDGTGGVLTPEMGLDRSKANRSGHRMAKTAPRRRSSGQPTRQFAVSARR